MILHVHAPYQSPFLQILNFILVPGQAAWFKLMSITSPIYVCPFKTPREEEKGRIPRHWCCCGKKPMSGTQLAWIPQMLLWRMMNLNLILRKWGLLTSRVYFMWTFTIFRPYFGLTSFGLVKFWTVRDSGSVALCGIKCVCSNLIIMFWANLYWRLIGSCLVFRSNIS